VVVVRAFGKNRIGVQEAVAELICRERGNIIRHDVNVFGDELTAVWAIEGDSLTLTAIEREIDQLGRRLGVSLSACQTLLHAPTNHLRFTISSPDFIGLLHAVSEAFTRSGYDIIHDHGVPRPAIDANVTAGLPADGGMFYLQQLEVVDAGQAKLKELHKALTRLYDRHGVLASKD